MDVYDKMYGGYSITIDTFVEDVEKLNRFLWGVGKRGWVDHQGRVHRKRKDADRVNRRLQMYIMPWLKR